ncbi:MAG: hypothetical protein NT113_17085 [Hyphomicrobiales bacterium]|nr:hypothetical protein [Hyphomicrobiales bacterium]
MLVPFRAGGVITTQDAIDQTWTDSRRRFGKEFRRNRHPEAELGNEFLIALNNWTLQERRERWLYVLRENLSILRAFENDPAVLEGLETRLTQELLDAGIQVRAEPGRTAICSGLDASDDG